VRGDRIRLEQALGNLLDNALRYGKGEVRLSAAQTDGVVELHVTDQGNGFPPELMEQAFERFARLDQARARGGSGLGLSIVRAIAEAHGGSAHLANMNGSGADVWVSLPSAGTTAEEARRTT
jgi:signal transduction histidine kinase